MDIGSAKNLLYPGEALAFLNLIVVKNGGQRLSKA